jgi:hypothetical protein
MPESKDLQKAVFAAADELLSQGITPTLSRIARSVGGERRDVQRALEEWAGKLSSASRDDAVRSRIPSNAIAADTLQEVARALTPHSKSPTIDDSGEHKPLTGSLVELEAELSNQTRALTRLRQREAELQAALAATQAQIRKAENRHRLLSESVANGGALLDQAALRQSRLQAKDPGEK